MPWQHYAPLLESTDEMIPFSFTAKNMSGVTIPRGCPVRPLGKTTGTYNTILVSLVTHGGPAGAQSQKKVVGVAETAIADGTTGTIINFGVASILVTGTVGIGDFLRARPSETWGHYYCATTPTQGGNAFAIADGTNTGTHTIIPGVIMWGRI